MTPARKHEPARQPQRRLLVAALTVLLITLPVQPTTAAAAQPQPEGTSSGTVRLLSPLYFIQTDADGRDRLLALWGIKTVSAPMPVYGMRAFDALRELVGTQKVVCTRYRLKVLAVERGHCRVGDIDINETLVRRGLALDDPLISGGRFGAAEAEARSKRAGLWGGSLGFFFAP